MAVKAQDESKSKSKKGVNVLSCVQWCKLFIIIICHSDAQASCSTLNYCPGTPPSLGVFPYQLYRLLCFSGIVYYSVCLSFNSHMAPFFSFLQHALPRKHYTHSVMWNRWRHHSAATTRHAIVGTSQTHGHTTLAPLLLSSSSADSVTNVSSTCSSCLVFTSTPLRATRVLLDKKKHTSKHHREVYARQQDVTRLSQPLEHVQQPLTSSTTSTAATHPPKDTRPTDERTAALLRSISRRGVSARRGEASPLHPLEEQPQPLAGRDVMASFFSSATTPTARGCAGDGTTRRTESPLAKLFAAPPPQQQQAPAKVPASRKSQETNNTRERNASTGRSQTESPSSFTASSASSSSFSVQPTARPPPPPPSRALLERLLHTIRREKRVPWADVARLHPEVARMPLYACRDEWCALLGTHGSAAPLSVNSDASSHSLEYSPPLFLCAAATGTGKSVLLPLFALDAHWAVLEARLEHSLRLYDTLTADNSTGTSTPPDVSVQMQGSAGVEEEAGEKQLPPQCAPFPLTSQADFIRAFTACSRLCIVVSQPTRVACAELAKYTSALLSTVQLQRRSVPPTATSFSSAAVDPSATPSSAGGDATQKVADAAAAADVARSLVGKRVGYAVGGEPVFCAETELIYATPGYVLNALQHTPSTAGMSASPSPPQRRLSPTTMMVDEAHCRDIETDALLAWMKLSRSGAARGSEASLMNCSARANEKNSSSNSDGSNTSSSRSVLRQYYVMSATMNLVAVDNYLSRPLELEPKSYEDHKRLSNKEGHLSSGAACEPPLLLLSPSQQNAVQRWWRASEVSENANARPSTSVQHTGTRHGDWRSAMVRDVSVRRAVLQVVEATDGEMGTSNSDAGERLLSGSTTYSPTSPSAASSSPSGAAASAAVSSLAGVQHTADASAGAPLPANIVVSSEPFIVERFFMDDIDPDGGCFAQSRVLFSDAVRQAAAAAAAVAATAPHGSPDADAAAAGQPSVTHDGSRASGHDRRRLSPPIDPRAFSHLPQCLTREGAAVRRVLAQAFDTRMSSYGSFATNSAQLAVFLVQLLQAARLRWSPSSSSSLSDGEHGELRGPPYSSVTTATAAAAAPITLLLFVPGIAEMYQTVHSLERLCERVQQQQSPASRDYTSSSSSSSVSPSVTVDVLRFGSELFSIGLLHSSAVGNPQDQLIATERTGAPLRLLIATNVAESSLTIPNTRIVVDTCLERRVRVDSVTGTTRVTTAFVSPSGLRQRCGRVGRTADGVVLHLSPRHFALPPADRQRHPRHPIPYKRSVVDTTPPAPLEPLAEGVVTVLLHLKFLFPRVTAALAALPSPPPAAELRVALQQLVDLDLLALPSPSPPRAASTHEAEKDATTRPQGATERREKSEHAKREAALSSRGGHAASTLHHLLNESTFTPKGLLVASLPLPYEHACLVYHGLQFLCVEETILMACAMAVPSLFIAPRVSAQSTVRVSERNYTASAFTWTHTAALARPALSPLEAFYRRLWLQRELAGFPPPRRATRSTTAQHTAAVTSRGGDAPVKKVEEGNSSDGGGDDADAATRAGHLSEPLLLLALLRQWYATASISGLVQLMAHYALNRSQLRQVDSMVEQCCQRLSALLQRDAHASARSAQPASRTSSAAAVEGGNEARGVSSLKSGDVGEEQDVSVYVSAALRDQLSKRETDPQAATRAPPPLLPFMQEWPEGMRGQLLRSLRRLQQAAHARAHLRGASQRSRSGLSQWFDSEERILRLCSQPYVRTHPHPSLSPPSQWKGRARQFFPATPHDDAVQQEGEEEEEDEGEDRQRRQRREAAVRTHPSFAHEKDRAAAAPSADSALPYPSLAAGSASLLSAVPPPLATRLVRSRSPVYHAPRPPPPPPPVAFVLGRSEDRLCAAFIAAFGHRTMRGEDGGHRFHHRRLVRNLQALQHDADHVCTFSVDVQSRGTSLVTTGRSAEAAAKAIVAPEEAREGGGATVSTPYETLEAAGVTADAVRQALEPYLAGSGLLQLELFRGNRLAVAARFATSGFDSLLDKANDGAKDVSPFASPLASLAAVEAQGMANGVLDTPVSSDETRSGAVAAVASGSTMKDVAGNKEERSGEEGRRGERDAATAETALLRPVPLSRIGLATLDEASTAHGAARAATVDGLSSAASIASRGAPAEHGESSSTRRSADVGNPYVQLAPFGVSLLIAAASSSLGGSGGGGGLGGLHRIPLPLPSANLASSRTQERQQQQQQEEGTGSSEAASVASVPSDGIIMVPAPSASSAHASTMNARAAPLFTTEASSAGMERFTVTWTDATSGVGKSLSRADVRALGLDHLFPSPPPAAAAVAAPSTQPSHAPTGASWSSSSPQPTLSTTAVAADARHRLSDLTDTAASAAGVAAASLPPSSASLTLSVLPPVYVTRSITWKVPLPSLFSLATTATTDSNKSSDDLQRLSPSPSSPLLPSSLRYCVLCQQLCASRLSFEQHCRSTAHLNHLHRAVSAGLSRRQLDVLYGYASTPVEDQRVASQGFSKRGRGTKEMKTPTRSSPRSVAAAAAPLLSLLAMDTAVGTNNSETVTGEVEEASVRGRRAGGQEGHSEWRTRNDAPYAVPLRFMTRQLHPCVIHPLSFLNCLQWRPRGRVVPPTAAAAAAPQFSSAGGVTAAVRVLAGAELADRATPLAVAGGLVSMQGSSDVLPPPHLRARTRASTVAIAADAEGGDSSSGSSIDGAVERMVPSPMPAVAAATLSANHVWVLNLSASLTPPPPPSASPSSSTSRHAPPVRHASPPPLSLLFVLAGYLAAASPQSMVAFLVNATHSHLHGVMLYSLGTWKLPQPLPVAEYMGVLEHVAGGGGWPGLLIPVKGHNESNAQRRECRDAVNDGLHWCVPSSRCRCHSPTPMGHASHNVTKAAEVTANETGDEAAGFLVSLWPTVEAALLLALHEYAQAQRNMVTLADYVERVLMKLQLSPYLQPPGASGDEEKGGRAGRASAGVALAHFIEHARGGQAIHVLLRDVGCVFLTPPHALTALLHAEGSSANTESVHRVKEPPSNTLHQRRDHERIADSAGSTWSRRLSARALSVEGAAVEVMFTVPAALPSVLPPTDFAQQLRQFYAERHKQRWESAEEREGAGGGVEAQEVTVRKATAPRNRRGTNSRERRDDPLRF